MENLLLNSRTKLKYFVMKNPFRFFHFFYFGHSLQSEKEIFTLHDTHMWSYDGQEQCHATTAYKMHINATKT